MKIRILSWNVRGANDRDKRRIIKSVIKSQRVDVVCLQETKIKEMTTGLVRSLGVGRNIEWRAVNSRGAAGGILVFWDNRLVELVGWEEGFSQFRAGSKVVWMVLCGCSLECMGRFAVEIERSFGRNLGQLKGYGVTLGVWEGISTW